MPQITDADGRTRYIPGTYMSTRVVTTLPGALPDFFRTLLIGQADQGFPQGLASDGDLLSYEVGLTPFVYCADDTSAARFCGPDSEIRVAMTYAKRHGLPGAVVLAANSLTRGKVVATSSGPVNQVQVRCTLWGVQPGWTKVKWASNVWSVLRPDAFSLITANVSSGATKIYVKNNSWAQPGMTIEYGANGVTNTAGVIRAVGTDYASGQAKPWIDLTAGVSGALNTSAYAGVALYGSTYEQVTGVTTQAAFIEALRSTGGGLDFAAEAHASSTDLLPASIATYKAFKDVSEWATVTAGTSPALTTGNVTSTVTLLDGGLRTTYIELFGGPPRSHYLASSSSTNHATLRDYAIARRVAGEPIDVTLGCAWGDIVPSATDDTSPRYRAGVLNSQDVALVANGHNRLGAYLSTGPAVWGLKVGAGLNHNLTNDDFVGVALWEAKWTTTQLEQLLRGGVITNNYSYANGIRWVVAQGLNTLQANAGLLWNVESRTTAFIQQRDLMDFVQLVIKGDLDVGAVGADGITEDSVRAIIARRVDVSLVKRGYVVGHSIGAITLNDAATGYDVQWSVRLAGLTDYITVTTSILIGNG